MAMNVFEAGKGINCVKINDNFSQLQTLTNDNETAIDTVANTALLKDGSNLTQAIVSEFQQQTPNIITADGTISLADNSANFLTLTDNGVISLPAVATDSYSHTITLVVEGSPYTLDLGTTYSILTKDDLDTTQPYSVLYMYHKVRGAWYYYISQ